VHWRQTAVAAQVRGARLLDAVQVFSGVEAAEEVT
jgi:hypothetical protein